MIVIFSMKDDYSTLKVCKWIEKLGYEFIRINKDDRCVLKSLHLNKNEAIIEINGEASVNLKDVTAVWYRRGGFIHTLKNEIYFNDNEILKDSSFRINKIMDDEYYDLAIFLQREFEKDKSIGSYFNSKLNKLNVLTLANSVGLHIPETFVLNNAVQVESLIQENNLITKALSDGLYYFSKKHAYYTYTEKVNKKHLSDKKEFAPSLFQIQIKKKFEIRSFFLNGSFYSMAIFSQKNTRTAIDYRKYDREVPNRNIRFKLPNEIEQKLIKLFDLLRLNTGSVDIIVDQDGNYVFLEINPIGQFSMTSSPCNYNLEKIMAEELIEIHKRNEHRN
ncbi:ATP-GRASP peptide maturase of grasp-with-spasm system [Chryseobacterium vietnamense]|uniref:grasp-with-spasm system ATP-grasp peptide maturase n=1 Tax=Chryseobacterium vietnamense TaxID=866785 RepID=UPI00285A7A54|nr:grasp-with-spasm system ATP-grasp peptide maturase [Chryseobacterium vietnamense]MDR6487276.1 ATP-GRASP peptide maturase of grasp-with-spasm system [Chryseobacterium vietnamense]